MLAGFSKALRDSFKCPLELLRIPAGIFRDSLGIPAGFSQDFDSLKRHNASFIPPFPTIKKNAEENDGMIMTAQDPAGLDLMSLFL